MCPCTIALLNIPPPLAIFAISKMGIAFQKLCYLIPNSFVKDSPIGKVKEPTRRKLMRRRKNQFDNIFKEARLWSTSMLLPLDILSEDPELYRTLERLSSRLLGQDINEHKINCKLLSIYLVFY